MTTTDNIGFKLIIAEPDVADRTVVVCPRYDNLKTKQNKPSGKMYYKKDLSGTIKFLGVDFWTIYNCALRTRFTLVVYQHGKGEVVRATFRKTDCKWDVSHKIATVDIQAADPYKKIEDNKDNEYNLVKLGLEKKAINGYIWPQMQAYFQDDDIITLCGQSGNPIQPNVGSNHDHNSLLNMGFSANYIITVTKYAGQYAVQPCSTASFSTEIIVRLSTTRIYELRITQPITTITTSQRSYEVCLGIDYSSSSAQTIDRFYGSDNIIFVLKWSDSWGVRYSVPRDINTGDPLATRFNSLYSLTHVSVAIEYDDQFLERVIFDCRLWVPYYGCATAYLAGGFSPITSSDITANINHNYKSRGNDYYGQTIYQFNYGMSEACSISLQTSETDLGYGRIEGSDLYYAPPANNGMWFPVRRDSWVGELSLWVKRYNTPSWLMGNGGLTAPFEVGDFYELTDAIRAVIKQINPLIEFDSQDSQFLFDTINPVDGASQNTLYITQKSNVLKLDYDYPAWLAPITWGKIETLLKNAFNCYWDLYERDGATHLRIEHRTFYDKGGTYTDNDPRETHDLRTVYRNSTPYSYADKTNRWEWDKDGNGDSTASRYEYSWMDTQTEMFDGKTIEVPEEYRLFDDDKLEDRKVDWFSSDIDFLISVTSECSSDGFAIVMESLERPGWIISGNENYPGQNYELSLEYLQPRYLLAGIYSPVVKIGDAEVQNAYTARLRKAEVDFRLLQGEDVEAGDILITEVGQGRIDSLEEDLHSGNMKAEIRYENE